MILSEGEIRSMVAECVERILEVHGAIDDRLEGLAKMIIGRIRNDEKKFTLSKSDIEAYYPYKNCPETLNVSSEFLPQNVVAAYNPYTNTVKVRRSAIMYNDEYLTEILMHELTHFVNNSESNNSLFSMGREGIGNEGAEAIAKKIMYLFEPTEMNARVSQFKYTLKQRMGKLHTFENQTRLKEMKRLIEIVEQDEATYDDEWTIVELLLYKRAQRKTDIDGKDRELNTSYENFERAKSAIVKKLKRAYKEYYNKIAKIYYDEISSSPQSNG